MPRPPIARRRPGAERQAEGERASTAATKPIWPNVLALEIHKRLDFHRTVEQPGQDDRADDHQVARDDEQRQPQRQDCRRSPGSRNRRPARPCRRWRRDRRQAPSAGRNAARSSRRARRKCPATRKIARASGQRREAIMSTLTGTRTSRPRLIRLGRKANHFLVMAGVFGSGAAGWRRNYRMRRAQGPASRAAPRLGCQPCQRRRERLEQPAKEGFRMTQAGDKTAGLTYSQAGVDIDAGARMVDLIKPLVRATRRRGADAEIGGLRRPVRPQGGRLRRSDPGRGQ